MEGVAKDATVVLLPRTPPLVLSLSKHDWHATPFHNPPFDKLRAGMEGAAPAQASRARQKSRARQVS
jgi:hypothetical protein